MAGTRRGRWIPILLTVSAVFAVLHDAIGSFVLLPAPRTAHGTLYALYALYAVVAWLAWRDWERRA